MGQWSTLKTQVKSCDLLSEEIEGVVEALEQLDGDGVTDYVFSSAETSINSFLIDLKAINSDLRDKVAKNNLLQDEDFKLDQNSWINGT